MTDFLNALEQARQLGLTKEEFIAVWEAEAKMNLKKEEARMMEMRQAGAAQNIQLEAARQGDTNGSFGTLLQQHMQQMFWEREELKQQFDLKFQHLHDQLIERQEQQWQNMQHSNNSMLEELRHHFQMLDTNLTNAMDSQTSALKLFFMHEMELMKQDVIGRLQPRLDEQRTGHSVLGTPEIHANESIPRNESGQQDGEAASNKADPAQASVPQVKLSMQQFQQAQMKHQMQLQQQQELNQRQQQQQQDSLQQHPQQHQVPQQGELSPHLQQNLQPQQSKQQQNQQHMQQASQQQQQQQQQKQQEQAHQKGNQQIVVSQLPSTSYATMAASKPIFRTGVTATSSSSLLAGQDGSARARSPRAPSAVSSDHSSVPGTGFYADLISSQMACRSSSPTSSIGSSVSQRGKTQKKQREQLNNTCAVRISSASSVGSNSGAASNPIRYLPVLEARFTINNCNEFCKSKKDLTTQFYYTSSNACRVRLRLRFNAEQKLNVHLLVSNGSINDSRRWPILFSGKGFIYNEPSARLTKLWEFPSSKCSKPAPGTEMVLSPKVCLTTLRGRYPDVTYETLELKRYVSENSFLIAWDLEAVEKSVVLS